MVAVSSATWLNAQHQSMAIEQPARQKTAPHVAAVLVATTGHIQNRLIRMRPTRHRRIRVAPLTAGALAAYPAEAQGLAGREEVRP